MKNITILIVLLLLPFTAFAVNWKDMTEDERSYNMVLDKYSEWKVVDNMMLLPRNMGETFNANIIIGCKKDDMEHALAGMRVHSSVVGKVGDRVMVTFSNKKLDRMVEEQLTVIGTVSTIKGATSLRIEFNNVISSDDSKVDISAILIYDYFMAVASNTDTNIGSVITVSVDGRSIRNSTVEKGGEGAEYKFVASGFFVATDETDCLPFNPGYSK